MRFVIVVLAALLAIAIHSSAVAINNSLVSGVIGIPISDSFTTVLCDGGEMDVKRDESDKIMVRCSYFVNAPEEKSNLYFPLIMSGGE